MQRKKKHNIIYKITNNQNGMIYIGCHTTNNLDDKYYGSGSKLLQDIKLLGKENFSKEILYEFDNINEMLDKEATIVDKNFIKRRDVYNQILGGGKLNTFGKAVVKDNKGNRFCVNLDDPRYTSGELVGANKGLVTVKDKQNNVKVITMNEFHSNTNYVAIAKDQITVEDSDGNTFNVDRSDPRYISGKLKHMNHNKCVVSDNEGHIFLVSKDDPRYISGELKSYLLNKVAVKDNKGHTFFVSKDDPRYISGELKHVATNRVSLKHKETGDIVSLDKNSKEFINNKDNYESININKKVVIDDNGNYIQVDKNDNRFKSVNTGKITVKDKNGNFYKVDTNDPRYLSGELVHVTKGLITVKNKTTGETLSVSKDDPRYLSGELVGVTKGMITVKHWMTGETLSVSKDDPRYITGELVGIRTNLKKLQKKRKHDNWRRNNKI